MSDDLRELFGETISTYSEEQGIADGFLVYPYPQKYPNLLLTRAVFDAIDAKRGERPFDQTCIPFLMDCVMVWNDHIRKTKGRDHMYAGEGLAGNVTRERIWIGANGLGGITVMLPSDN